MRPWIRKYRFYRTFAPRGRLKHEAYNVVPFNFTFLITFKNDLYKSTLYNILSLIHLYQHIQHTPISTYSPISSNITLYIILHIQLYQLMTFANIITFPNGIKTIINNYLFKDITCILLFNYNVNYLFFSLSLFQPMSTKQADMSTKIRFVKTDDAFIINHNTKRAMFFILFHSY